MSIYIKNDAYYGLPKVESFKFPGGEIQVRVENWVERFEPYAHLVAYLYSSDDIMTLLLTVDALRRTLPNTRITLTIPYFPYARQDRVCVRGEAFSLEVMANLINSLNAQEVIVYDPHSNVLSGLIKNLRVLELGELIRNEGTIPTLFNAKDPTKIGIAVIPDKGAKQRGNLIYSMLNPTWGLPCEMKKNRSPKTGHISSISLDGSQDLRWIDDHPLWIFDDICDGGRTFVMIREYFAQATEVNLVVTHGIFSNFDNLKSFNKVYCFTTPHKHSDLPENVTVLGGEYDQ